MINIVDNAAVNRRGEAGVWECKKGSGNLEIYCQYLEKVGWEDRVMDQRRSSLKHLENSGDNGCSLGIKEETPDHSFSHILADESRLSPHDPPRGHRIVWVNAGLPGQSCPDGCGEQGRRHRAVTRRPKSGLPAQHPRCVREGTEL